MAFPVMRLECKLSYEKNDLADEAFYPARIEMSGV